MAVPSTAMITSFSEVPAAKDSPPGGQHGPPRYRIVAARPTAFDDINDRLTQGLSAYSSADLLFACYHLHVPWVIPQTLLVDTFALALPARRWRSSLIAIAVHSAQTVFFFVIALVLVLR